MGFLVCDWSWCTLCPDLLSQLQVQKSASNLVKHSKTLSLIYVVYITSDYCWTQICQHLAKGLEWMGTYILLKALTTAHTSRASSPCPETCIRTSFPFSWALWPWLYKPCITVWDIQWGNFRGSPDRNLTAEDRMLLLQKAIKTHPALDFSPEGGAVRNSQGIPVRLSVFYPLQHLIYHQKCFFPCFAICSLTLSLKEEVIFST
jgi:hypothetical protein